MTLSARSDKPVILVCGQPWRGDHVVHVFGPDIDHKGLVYFPGNVIGQLGGKGDIDAAFKAARAARFEHGESG